MISFLYFLKFAYILKETIYLFLIFLSLSFFLYFLKFAYLLREAVYLSLYSRLCISGYSFFFLFLSPTISKNLDIHFSFSLYFLKFAFILRETLYLSLYSRLCILGYSFFFFSLSALFPKICVHTKRDYHSIPRLCALYRTVDPQPLTQRGCVFAASTSDPHVFSSA